MTESNKEIYDFTSLRKWAHKLAPYTFLFAFADFLYMVYVESADLQWEKLPFFLYELFKSGFIATASAYALFAEYNDEKNILGDSYAKLAIAYILLLILAILALLSSVTLRQLSLVHFCSYFAIVIAYLLSIYPVTKRATKILLQPFKHKQNKDTPQKLPC